MLHDVRQHEVIEVAGFNLMAGTSVLPQTVIGLADRDALSIGSRISPVKRFFLVQQCINNQAKKSIAINVDLWQNGKKKQGEYSHAIRSSVRKYTR